MDAAHARELLERERARVEGALADFAPPTGDDDRPDPFDNVDDAPELVEAQIGEAQAEQLREELTAIERAEQRLADGTYGLSVQSGEPIPDARLETLPWAERTAEEQARLESGR
jgi:DnaK suppressor protein